MDRKFLYGLAVLVGTTVGGGIFGLPYVVSKAGLIPALLYFLILGASVLLVTFFFGEIILRTKEDHRLVGYADHYLGKKGKVIVTVSTILGMIGALLAYLIIGGNFLEIVFSPWFGFSSFQYSLMFWLILSFFVFKGIKLIAPAELAMNFILVSIILLIFLFALPKIDLNNFVLFNPSHLFLPYGVILFSLVGWTAIPEIGAIFKKKDNKKYKRIIALSALVVIFLYLIFIITVVGVSGSNTSQNALSGLIPILGLKIIMLGALFGTIAVAASFLVLGLYLKNTLVYDFDFSRKKAFLISCLGPLILFLIGFRSFIEVIGLTGTLIGALEGVIIILIFKKSKQKGKRKPEYSLTIPSFLLYFLIAVFILGAIAQIFFEL